MTPKYAYIFTNIQLNKNIIINVLIEIFLFLSLL